MSRSGAEILARQEELIARSAMHREEIAGAVSGWLGTLHRVDQVLEVTGKIRRSVPWLGMALTAGMFVLPRGGAAWIGRAQNAVKSITSIVSIAVGLRG